jgi:cyclophilin family peptidyl-prolyl cis-trans isomerase
MKKIIYILLTFLLTTNMSNAMMDDNTIHMKTKYGTVVIQMLPEEAPKHVARIKQLVREGFYDGLKFHRVIAGFMAQTGDPLGTGFGGSGQSIPGEFNSTPHVRGVVSMARSASPDSADSQFFIVLADTNHLDGQYTAWGKVTKGMEFVDKIKKGSGPGGTVTDPDVIISMKMSTDAKGEATKQS